MIGDSVNQNEFLFQKITSFLNTLFNNDHITVQNSFLHYFFFLLKDKSRRPYLDLQDRIGHFQDFTK